MRMRRAANMHLQQRAHKLLVEAVRLRIIHKPKKCQGCGAQKRLEGHHTDYAQPLTVTWLCKRCHADWHQPKARERRLEKFSKAIECLASD